MGLAPRFSW